MITRGSAGGTGDYIRLTGIFFLIKNCWSFDLSLLLAVFGFIFSGRLIKKIKINKSYLI
jgi:hypothetical protein